MIGYCEDCRHCIIINAADRYGLCMHYGEVIRDVEYHSCTKFEGEKREEKKTYV